MKSSTKIFTTLLGVYVVLIAAGVSFAQVSPSVILPISTGGVSVTNCPLITSFMKLGAINDSSQVSALQGFLNIEVSGIFDDNTKKAVEDFQRKYMNEVMAPWDATRPSGIVYLTTMKKINQLACGEVLSLNDKELSIINSYKTRVSAGLVGDNGTIEQDNTVLGPGVEPTYAVDEVKLEFNSAGGVKNDVFGQADQAAAVGDSEVGTGDNNLVKRFFSYIVNLFK